MHPETESLEGLGGTVSQRPCGVMPAWPFVFYYKGRSWRQADIYQGRQSGPLRWRTKSPLIAAVRGPMGASDESCHGFSGETERLWRSGIRASLVQAASVPYPCVKARTIAGRWAGRRHQA